MNMDLTPEERRAADFTREPADEFHEYASGIEGIRGYEGELVDLAIDVEADNPNMVGLAYGNSSGDSDGVAMTIEQAEQFLEAWQQAILVAKANARKM